MQLLNGEAVNFSTIEYLKEPLTAEALDALCTMLDMEPQSLIRSKEARFAELGLTLDDDRSRGDWIALMVDNPILIERPIIVIDGKAVIGRPPENIYTLLGSGR